jgi:hypothetical protein
VHLCQLPVAALEPVVLGLVRSNSLLQHDTQHVIGSAPVSRACMPPKLETILHAGVGDEQS